MGAIGLSARSKVKMWTFQDCDVAGLGLGLLLGMHSYGDHTHLGVTSKTSVLNVLLMLESVFSVGYPNKCWKQLSSSYVVTTDLMPCFILWFAGQSEALPWILQM